MKCKVTIKECLVHEFIIDANDFDSASEKAHELLDDYYYCAEDHDNYKVYVDCENCDEWIDELKEDK